MGLAPDTRDTGRGTREDKQHDPDRPTPFVPAWWCRGAHAQTLWPYCLRRSPKIALRRERLELPDGDFLDLDWTQNPDGPIVLVLHGLEGSSNSKYARGLLAAVQARPWRGAVMHFRGCSGVPNRLPRSYHSGETGDLAHVIAELRRREPQAALAVVGYSLGANVLLKWLGEAGARAPLAAAVAVSPPFVLECAAARLERGLSRIYQWALLRRLRASMTAKLATVPLPFDGRMLAGLKTFRQFDDRVTAPLHGFRDAQDYYTRSSCRQFLKAIAVPTLILHARDDPFTTEEAIPETCELSDSVRLELSTHGGHVGFVSGRLPWQARYWLEERIPQFLAHYLAVT